MLEPYRNLNFIERITIIAAYTITILWAMMLVAFIIHITQLLKI